MTGRYFTVTGSGIVGENGGRYAAKDNIPMTAAKKAGARLYRDLSEAQIATRLKNGNKTIRFILKETTRGSTKKTYTFKVERKALNKISVVEIHQADGTKVSIEHKFKYIITKCANSV
jgi:hypothetical protein